MTSTHKPPAEERLQKGERLKPGDKVEGGSFGTGTVIKEITERTEAAGRTVNASHEEPQYLIRGDRKTSSGEYKEAVHKPTALKKVGEGGTVA